LFLNNLEIIMNQEVQNVQIRKILAKCWEDAFFKQRLLADPAAVLKAEGVEIPADYTVRVLENTDKVINYVLPPNPNVELSDSDLEAVAGGTKVGPTQNEQMYGPNGLFPDKRRYAWFNENFAKNGGAAVEIH
jgi:hypothetical protein